MRLLITFFLFLLPLLSFSQSLFQRTYGTASAEERAFEMVILPDHSVITIGDRYETSTFQRTGYLLKVDADGNEEWTRQITGNDDIYGTTICQLPNGNVLTAGYDYTVPNREYGLMIAVFQSGNGLPVYQKTHELLQNTKAVGVVPMPDDGAVVLCEFGTTSSHTNLLCRLDANGDTLWTKTIDPFPENENPTSLVAVSDGLVIGGSVIGATTSTENSFLIKTDFNGNILWSYDDQSAPTVIAGKMAEDPMNGGFYMAATTQIVGQPIYKVLGLKNDNGSSTWLGTYSTQTDRIDFGNAVTAMPDGGAVFIGSAYKADTSNFRDLFLVRTDASGNELWSMYYGASGAETGYDVQVDGDQIVACGKADVNDSEDIIILRTDLNGNTSVGINDQNLRNSFNIFPNPFTDVLNITVSDKKGNARSVKITDLSGRMLWQSSVSNRTSVNLTWLPAGIYLLHAENTLPKQIIKL